MPPTARRPTISSPPSSLSSVTCDFGLRVDSTRPSPAAGDGSSGNLPAADGRTPADGLHAGDCLGDRGAAVHGHRRGGGGGRSPAAPATVAAVWGAHRPPLSPGLARAWGAGAGARPVTHPVSCP